MMEMPLAERILNHLLHGPMQMNPQFDVMHAQDRAVRIIAREIEEEEKFLSEASPQHREVT